MSYASLATTALSLLTKFGRDVTHRSYTAGTYDPAAGSTTPATADTTRKGVILDFGAGVTAVRGTQIEGTDKRLLLDADGDVPSLKSHFLVGADEYVTISVGEINPAGTPVLYDLHVRK